MKTYTVKQIAKALGTQEETVRRWIRNKKIHAKQSSRKEGNIVSEEALREFLVGKPKYLAKLFPSISTVSSAVDITSAVSLGIPNDHVGHSVIKKLLSELPEKELRDRLNKSIAKNKESILQKKLLLKQIESDIEKLQSQIEQYEEILKTCDKDNQ